MILVLGLRCVNRVFDDPYHDVRFVALSGNVDSLQNRQWKSRRHIDDMVLPPTDDVFKMLLELAGARHPRDRAAVALGLGCGFRESELLELRVGGVDFDAGTVRVWRAKQDEWHVVPMWSWVRTELEAWFTRLEAAHGPLQPEWHVLGARPVPKVGTGTFYTNMGLSTETPVIPWRQANGVTRDIQIILKAAGMQRLEHTGAHTLRRMAGMHLRNKTGNLRDAKTLYGHKRELDTEHYLQCSEDRDRLAEAMAQASPSQEPEPGGNVISLAARRRLA